MSIHPPIEIGGEMGEPGSECLVGGLTPAASAEFTLVLLPQGVPDSGCEQATRSLFPLVRILSGHLEKQVEKIERLKRENDRLRRGSDTLRRRIERLARVLSRPVSTVRSSSKAHGSVSHRVVAGSVGRPHRHLTCDAAAGNIGTDGKA
jgi:hypothetical protein